MALRDRVTVTGVEALKSASVTRIELADGRVISVRSDQRPPGRNPALQRDAVSRKFLQLVEPVLGRDAAVALRQRIESLHTAESVSPLVQGAARRTASMA